LAADEEVGLSAGALYVLLMAIAAGVMGLLAAVFYTWDAQARGVLASEQRALARMTRLLKDPENRQYLGSLRKTDDQEERMLSSFVRRVWRRYVGEGAPFTITPDRKKGVIVFRSPQSLEWTRMVDFMRAVEQSRYGLYIKQIDRTDFFYDESGQGFVKGVRVVIGLPR